MSDVGEIIRTRRSVGKVDGGPVERAVLEELIDLATNAPNHHMREPWRFVVVQGDARRRVGAAHARAYARTHPDAPNTTLERETLRFMRAPAVIVAVVHPADDDPIARREDRDAVAASVQNMLLAAHGRGLGAIWRTGTMADEAEVREALDLAVEDEIVAFVYLGRPAIEMAPKPRRPVNEVTRWLE